jgi:hypothetical protein
VLWEADRPGAILLALNFSRRQDEGGVDLPLSTETGESIYGKVGCVGDHLG